MLMLNLQAYQFKETLMFGEIMYNQNFPVQANCGYLLQPLTNKWQDFPREAAILQELLGDTYEAIAEFDGLVAGGAVTSVFNRSDVNDFDLYFPSEEKAAKFVAALWAGEYGYQQFMNVTDKSMTFVRRAEDVKCQLIYYKFFPTPKDIFQDFDFTVNMGCFSPKTGKFLLHDDFLRHNSQRTIQINTNTAYPLISVLRTAKYKDKGYHTSKPQLMRLLLAITQLNLESWEDVEAQLGGMYGYNVKDIFDKTKPFSIEAACVALEGITPKKLESMDTGSVSWEDVQKAVVEKFPEDFQRLPSNSWAYGFTKELEAYAFPGGKPVAEPCPLAQFLDGMNKPSSEDLPF
jgi:hypothetical protein